MSLITPRPARAVKVAEVVPDLYRVETAGRTVGYVVRAGRVYVALEGSVYNTSIEVAQTLDLESSVEALAA